MALLNMNELIDNYDTSTFMSIQLKRIEHDTLIYALCFNAFVISLHTYREMSMSQLNLNDQ